MIVLFDIYIKLFDYIFKELLIHTSLKFLISKFDDVNTITMEENNGIQVYIGSESEISDDMAVVKTKYNYNGEEGTIAIVGPKRMEYDKVVSLLDYVKNKIGGDNE